MNSAISQVESEGEAKKSVGRPAGRTEVQDKLYFDARALGKSKSSACVIAGYNYGTVVNHWVKQEDWIAAEALAKDKWLDSLEDVVAEDMKVNAAHARKQLSKHRKIEYGEEAAEVKITHQIDIEGALSELFKLTGINEATGGPEDAGSGSTIEGSARVISEDKP